MEVRLPPRICRDKDGFAYLAQLNAQIQHCFLDTITVDMERTAWFDAEMCAVLGAILHQASNNVNAV